MTPNILPYLLEADRREPSLKIINSAYSCFKLLQLTLALAGPEWSFIGKTRDMDGASVTPEGFVPFTQALVRPDGQAQTVTIAGVSMDAAWYVPSRMQVKVIANSSANDDPNPAIHGPARLTPYEIDPQHYRWHNPPVRQERVPFANRPAPVPTPTPIPTPAPTPPALIGVPRDELRSFFLLLNDEYHRRGRGNRTTDVRDPLYVDNEGLYVWLPEFIRYRQVGQSYEQAAQAVMADIARAWS